MKLLFINGSPHKDGCTAAALREVSRTLEELGIETETHWVGNKPVPGCIACGSCKEVCPQQIDIPGYLSKLSAKLKEA